MTDSKIINLIVPLHQARRQKNDATADDKKITAAIRKHMLENELEELWDDERSVGVACKETSSRWFDPSGLKDPALILAAYERGLFSFNLSEFDSLVEKPSAPNDPELIDKLKPLVRRGAGTPRITQLGRLK